MTAPAHQAANEAAKSATSKPPGKVGPALRQNLWLPLAGAGLGMLLAVAYLYFGPKTYLATAAIKLGTDQLRALDLPQALRPEANGTVPGARLKEIRDRLLSPSLLARVVDTKNLATNPGFSPSPEDAAAGTPSLAAHLASLLTVEIPNEESLVKVTVAHPNAQMAAALANAIVDELVQTNTRSRDRFLNDLTNQLQQRVSAAERSLAPDREEARRLKARQEDAAQRLVDLRSKVAGATELRSQLATQAQVVEQQGTNTEALLRLSFIAADPKVAATRVALAEKEVAFDKLKQRYKSKYPAYVEAERELAGIQLSLADAAQAAGARLKVALDAARTTEADLQRDVAQLNADASKTAQELAERTKSISTQEKALGESETILQQLQKAAQDPLSVNPLTVVSAGVPLQPSRPDRMDVLLLGLLGGLLAGLFTSLVVGMVDTSFKSVEEAEQLLGLTVLSAVPPVPARQPKPGPLGPEDEAHFAVAEAFRSLRTSVSVISKEKELKSFLFTSATPKEGKTLCALGYAVSLAQQGLRTLLIECDLRRPMAAVALSGIKQDARGVSDYLKTQPSPSTFQPAEPKARTETGLSFAELRRKQNAVTQSPAVAPAPVRPAGQASGGGVTLDEILQKTEIEGLSFISAGTPVPNPAELLARQGLTKLLGETLRRFDRIVIDAAPLMGISDTLLLVNQVQATCLVVRAHQTPRRAVLRTVEMLRRADAPLLGAVLNDFSAGKSERYGDYYRYYGRDKPAANARKS